ncbi:MAG: sugar isomerase domain-containing protein [Oscillospiraceae bacterium]|nr:sugar isomerase domain-containing protein [Oscillospiraceae bacterium]
MLAEKFYGYCEKLMQDVKRDEMAAMEKASDMIADAVEKSYSFFIHDRGHLIGGELLARAGGAAFVRRLEIPLPDPTLMNPNTGSRKASRLSGDALIARKRIFEAQYIDYAFDVNGIGEGDVLLLNSNSGYGFSAVAIAETAKRKGVKLIVMSSKITSEAITPEGGEKKLADFADILFDNHSPYGDAVFEVDGLDERFWPASGMGAVYIAWPLVMMTVEKLLARGVSPTIFRSVNVPGGPQQNKKVVERYEELGY